MFNVHDDDRLVHKESGMRRCKQDNKAETALHDTLKQYGVFSQKSNESLQNAANKDLATPEIEQSHPSKILRANATTNVRKTENTVVRKK